MSICVCVCLVFFFYSHCTFHFLNSFRWVRPLLLNTKHNDQGTACGNRKWKEKCQLRIEMWNGKKTNDRRKNIYKYTHTQKHLIANKINGQTLNLRRTHFEWFTRLIQLLDVIAKSPQSNNKQTFSIFWFLLVVILVERYIYFFLFITTATKRDRMSREKKNDDKNNNQKTNMKPGSSEFFHTIRTNTRVRLTTEIQEEKKKTRKALKSSL